MKNVTVTVTAKLSPGLDPVSARDDVRAFLAWRPRSPDPAQLEAAWRLQDRNGLSCWDAQIVAAAQLSGSRILLTEELQPGQVFGDVQVVSPFQDSSGSD